MTEAQKAARRHAYRAMLRYYGRHEEADADEMEEQHERQCYRMAELQHAQSLHMALRQAAEAQGIPVPPEKPLTLTPEQEAVGEALRALVERFRSVLEKEER